MSLHRKTIKARNGDRGFSLVSAIFLLVVLAALGVAMVNISTVHQTDSALDVQGARAYQAARAGVEWGLFRQIRQSQCTGPTSFALPAGSTLGAFTVTVECTFTPGAAPELNRWRIKSTACSLPQAAEPRCPNPSTSTDYVERVVQVDF